MKSTLALILSIMLLSSIISIPLNYDVLAVARGTEIIVAYDTEDELDYQQFIEMEAAEEDENRSWHAETEEDSYDEIAPEPAESDQIPYQDDPEGEQQ